MFELMMCITCKHTWDRWRLKYPQDSNTAVEYQGSECPRCGSIGYSLSANKPAPPDQKRIDKGLYWDRAWSLVEGCTPVSEGCLNCWAAEQAYMRQYNEKVAYRYKGLTNDQGRFNGKIRLMEKDLEKPLHVRKPTVWAIWNDLFHEDVPEEFIVRAWTAMGEFYGKDGEIQPVEERPGHAYLVLTKRVDRMAAFLSVRYPKNFARRNVWIGATAENQSRLDKRIGPMFKIFCPVRFISLEPLLGPIDFEGRLRTSGVERPHIDWVIAGCESGPKRRPAKLKWFRDIRDQCVAASVPFFLKQMDINGKLVKMPELDGKRWAEFPNDSNRM